jgi:LmbE family N-acetylglucosaminyl deacetylase
MAAGITYYRRAQGKVAKSPVVSDIFTGWNSQGERWLFLAAHDDDIVSGGGLIFQAALAEGVEVHAVITTSGDMGYCRPEQRLGIAAIRRGEAEASFRALGLPPANLHFLHFPDCNLNPYRGRRFLADGDAAANPAAIAGAIGLQNSYPHVLRKIRPTRVFLPTITDLHPDHRICNEEMQISLFHAQGSIWPELGPPIEAIPSVYEYATYCDFPEPPQIRIETPAAMLQKKLAAIRAYASQEQIELLVDVQREIGPVEYVREVQFHFYAPAQYEKLFLTDQA